MPLLYTGVRSLLRLGLRAYYREIDVHGRENIPPDGPSVFVANHQNSMMDPFLIIATTQRPLAFLAKAPLFRTPGLGAVLRGLGCIPVHRKQDPGYDKSKNEGIYDAAYAALGRGRALAIFPEGKSHTEPHLEELRHGASKIALEAEMRHGGVRVQMVGIHFEEARGFRGKVLLQFGPAVGLRERREAFAKDPRAATAALTDDLRAGLSNMILEAESHEILRLAELVQKFDVLQRGLPADLKERFDRKKFILESYRDLRERRPREVEALRVDLARYRRIMDRLGVEDEQVERGEGRFRLLFRTLGWILWLVATLPVMAAGIAGNFPPYLLTWGLSRLIAREPAVVPGIAVQISLPAFPLYWAGLAVAGWQMAGGPGAVLAPAGAIACGAAALRWMDAWRRLWREAWGGISAGALRRLRARVLRRVELLTKT